jgi:hypothetical protein
MMMFASVHGISLRLPGSYTGVVVGFNRDLGSGLWVVRRMIRGGRGESVPGAQVVP